MLFVCFFLYEEKKSVIESDSDLLWFTDVRAFWKVCEKFEILDRFEGFRNKEEDIVRVVNEVGFLGYIYIRFNVRDVIWSDYYY